MVHGLWQTALVGVVGALLAELIRIGSALRTGKPPGRMELAASAVFVALGAGAALFGWTAAQPVQRVAVLGAAFPLLFSASINTVTAKEQRRSAAPTGRAQPSPDGPSPQGDQHRSWAAPPQSQQPRSWAPPPPPRRRSVTDYLAGRF
jgi:hypothetical protein